MTPFMEGYYAAMQDMMQALDQMSCRGTVEHKRGDWDCLVRRIEVEACLRGFMRGAEP